MTIEITSLLGLPPNATINEIERRAYVTNSALYPLVKRLDVYKINPEKEEGYVTKNSAQAVLKYIEQHRTSVNEVTAALLDLIELNSAGPKIQRALFEVTPKSSPTLEVVFPNEQAKLDQLPPLEKQTLKK